MASTTPMAGASPAPGATPAAAPAAVAPAAVAAILPPAAAPSPGASPTPAANASPTAAKSDEGLLLYLNDPLSATSSSYNWSIIAYKSRHEIEVLYKRRPYKTYHAVFGRSRFGGPKQWEGDRRTPEGNYLIVSKHRSARFGWFMKINYPNAADQASFVQLKAERDIPRWMREGGAVGIHGTDLPILNSGNIDWTTGCISVDNSAIHELARLLPLGTLVVIKP
jgi:L,D-transpeptidase catalytic domain